MILLHFKGGSSTGLQLRCGSEDPVLRQLENVKPQGSRQHVMDHRVSRALVGWAERGFGAVHHKSLRPCCLWVLAGTIEV